MQDWGKKSPLYNTVSHKCIKHEAKLSEFLLVKENNQSGILMIVYIHL